MISSPIAAVSFRTTDRRQSRWYVLLAYRHRTRRPSSPRVTRETVNNNNNDGSSRSLRAGERQSREDQCCRFTLCVLRLTLRCSCQFVHCSPSVCPSISWLVAFLWVASFLCFSCNFSNSPVSKSRPSTINFNYSFCLESRSGAQVWLQPKLKHGDFVEPTANKSGQNYCP